MAAIVTCEKGLQREISVYLQTEIAEYLEDTDRDLDAIDIVETENGLEVSYPVGEIYGYDRDYVEGVGHVFKMLKKKYKGIGVRGVIYHIFKYSGQPAGVYFCCQPEDLTILNVLWYIEGKNISYGDCEDELTEEEIEELEKSILCEALRGFSIDFDDVEAIEDNDNEDGEGSGIVVRNVDDVLYEILEKRIISNNKK